MHAKRVHTYTCSRSCSPCQNLVDYGNNKIMLCIERCQSLQSVEPEVGHITDEEGEEEEAVLASLT